MPATLATLNALIQGLTHGQTTAVHCAQAALDRADDPAGEGARVFTHRDPEQTMAAAEASDMLRSAGLARSPLEGIPISVKDLFDVEGQITRAGSVVLNDAARARRHAPVIKRLLDAGAVIVGRTNMTEFAYSGLGLNPHHGTPRNPWDRATARIPGGSSSGAAVSVSDGMAAAGIGSDTGGSVRIPAALCGLTGFKPTAKRVPLAGVSPLSHSLDSIGAIAPSVACCALLDSVMAGETTDMPTAATLAGLRFLVPTSVVLDDMDATVEAAFEAALARLAAEGARIDRLPIAALERLGAMQSRASFTATEAYAWHRDLIARHADRYDPRIVSRIQRGATQLAADYVDLLAARQAWIDEVEHVVAGYDAMLMPTVPVIAPAIAPLVESDEAYYAMNALILRNPTFINMLDGCALSVPCHAPGGAPVGLSIAGLRCTDKRILSIGLSVEAAIRHST